MTIAATDTSAGRAASISASPPAPAPANPPASALADLSAMLEELRRAVQSLQASLGPTLLGGGPQSGLQDGCCGSGNIGAPAQGVVQQAALPASNLSITGNSQAVGVVQATFDRMRSTVVGGRMVAELERLGGLPAVRVLDDAAFDASVRGAGHATAYYADLDGVPTVTLRQSSATIDADQNDLARVLAHELYHALDTANGGADYAAAVGTAGANLTAEQKAVGNTVMRESGSESVATVVEAELMAGEKVRQKLATPATANAALQEAYASTWANIAKTPDYNQAGYVLPQAMDPALIGLFGAA